MVLIRSDASPHTERRRAMRTQVRILSDITQYADSSPQTERHHAVCGLESAYWATSRSMRTKCQILCKTGTCTCTLSTFSLNYLYLYLCTFIQYLWHHWSLLRRTSDWAIPSCRTTAVEQPSIQPTTVWPYHSAVPPGVKDVSVWLTETPTPSGLLFVVFYTNVLTYLKLLSLLMFLYICLIITIIIITVIITETHQQSKFVLSSVELQFGRCAYVNPVDVQLRLDCSHRLHHVFQSLSHNIITTHNSSLR